MVSGHPLIYGDTQEVAKHKQSDSHVRLTSWLLSDLNLKQVGCLYIYMGLQRPYALNISILEFWSDGAIDAERSNVTDLVSKMDPAGLLKGSVVVKYCG